MEKSKQIVLPQHGQGGGTYGAFRNKFWLSVYKQEAPMELLKK
jgi:hypothetical protein